MTDFAIPGLMTPQAPVYDGKGAFYELPSYDKGNSLWAGISLLGPVYQDDGETPPAHEASSAVLEFRGPTTPEDMEADLKLTTGEGGVIISDASLWRFSVPPQELTLARGIWSWRFIVTSDGEAVMISEGILPVT